MSIWIDYHAILSLKQILLYKTVLAFGIMASIVWISTLSTDLSPVTLCTQATIITAALESNSLGATWTELYIILTQTMITHSK